MFFGGRRLSDPRGALPSAAAGLADGQAAQARARPQGRRAPGPAGADRRCAAARDRAARCERLREDADERATSPVTNITAPTPTHFRVEGVPPAQDAAFRTGGRRGRRPTSTAIAGTNGTYTFTMKPNIAGDLRERGGGAGAQTIERRVNELGVTEPSIAQQGRPAIRSWCSCPASPTSSAPRKSSASTGLLELKIVEQGPARDTEALLQSTASCPAGMEIVPGVGGAGDAGDRRSTWCEGRGGHRPRPAQRPAVARREQPAGGQLHAEHRRRAASSARSPARTSASSWRSSSTAACSRRRASRADHRRRPHHRQLHARKKCRTCR